MILECVRRYANAREVYELGTVFETDDEHGAWLMRDDPLAFQVVKEITAPPQDKAIKSPPRSKSVRRKKADV
jgi:hypothetical protein